MSRAGFGRIKVTSVRSKSCRLDVAFSGALISGLGVVAGVLAGSGDVMDRGIRYRLLVATGITAVLPGDHIDGLWSGTFDTVWVQGLWDVRVRVTGVVLSAGGVADCRRLTGGRGGGGGGCGFVAVDFGDLLSMTDIA